MTTQPETGQTDPTLTVLAQDRAACAALEPERLAAWLAPIEAARAIAQQDVAHIVALETAHGPTWRTAARALERPAHTEEALRARACPVLLRNAVLGARARVVGAIQGLEQACQNARAARGQEDRVAALRAADFEGIVPADRGFRRSPLADARVAFSAVHQSALDMDQAWANFEPAWRDFGVALAALPAQATPTRPGDLGTLAPRRERPARATGSLTDGPEAA